MKSTRGSLSAGGRSRRVSRSGATRASGQPERCQGRDAREGGSVLKQVWRWGCEGCSHVLCQNGGGVGRDVNLKMARMRTDSALGGGQACSEFERPRAGSVWRD